MRKINVAILGSGNIGMNLLIKVLKSPYLNCICLAGRNGLSENLLRAKDMGINTSSNSINAILELIDKIDIVFDATNAEAHKKHSCLLKNYNVFTIDFTPSQIGKMCLPCLGEAEYFTYREVNMITCGGQSMVPIGRAISDVCPNVKYMEVVSTIPSCSAGEGTRQNIDEYILTTQKAILEFTNAQKAKAMLVLNPADPPIIMRNTIYAILGEHYSLEKITSSVLEMEKRIIQYVPGFKIIMLPTYIQPNTIAVSVQVRGSGDFLPDYAGNLDIITCAGIQVAETYAQMLLKETNDGSKDI